MADEVIDIIFQPGAPQFQFFNFLIRREINFLFDAVNRVVQSVIFVKHLPKMIIGTLEAPNHFTMFREFPKNWMMKVHGVFVSV